MPIRASDLTQALVDDAQRFGCTSDALLQFAGALQDVIDQETGAFERQLADTYGRFNPDRETRPQGDAGPPDVADYELLHTQLAYLLDKANYEELDDVQIEQAVLRAKSRNLKVRVHPDRVDFLEVWVRGRGETAKFERSVWRPWRTERVKVPVFKRMVVVARLKDDPHVVLKLFKEIPEADVEALLPHAEVTMSMLDRVKLLGSTAGTIGLTITKVAKLMAAVAALWYLTWIVAVGVATLGVRAVLGYRNARINRDWQRTQHLYFQNLGNNASALQLLVATVKQEEYKEALLAYLFQHAQRVNADRSPGSDLRQEIEQYLRDRFKVEVDFDIDDAEAKLTRLGLRHPRHIAELTPIEEAISRLQQLHRRTGTAARILDCG